ncbi:unnamed protein product [Knipowitschia caucasica]
MIKRPPVSFHPQTPGLIIVPKATLVQVSSASDSSVTQCYSYISAPLHLKVRASCEGGGAQQLWAGAEAVLVRGVQLQRLHSGHCPSVLTQLQSVIGRVWIQRDVTEV